MLTDPLAGYRSLSSGCGELCSTQAGKIIPALANSLFPKEHIKDYFRAYLWEGSLARPHLSVPSDVLLRILLPNRLIENKVVVTHGKTEEGRDKKG